MCVCSLTYPACSAHVPYCYLWPASFYSVFSTLSHKRHDFRKKKYLQNTKCVFWVPLQLLSETFLILRTIQRDMIKKISAGLRVKYFFFRFLMTLAFSTNMKKSDIKFRENPSIGSRVFPCGATERYDDASVRFCGLVVRVSGYRYRGPGFDPRRYQIF